jgi:hypothetical protein
MNSASFQCCSSACDYSNAMPGLVMATIFFFDLSLVMATNSIVL